MINRRSISALALSGVLALGVTGAAQARGGGSDDPPSHDARDDHGKRRGGHGADDNAKSARHARHHRRHRGHDDGPNHT